MDSDRSQPSSPFVSEGDFGFAFNDVNFSDRLLLIEITGGESLPFSDDGEGWHVNCTTVERVKELHISSSILAAKSPFFYKLFSNGMKESEQRHVTLRVDSSEEAALMELLKFMYSSTLSVTSVAALLDVLTAADKFEVASCIRYCSRLLRNMPMTTESAVLYLELPPNVVMAEGVQPLIDASRQFLATRFKDIHRFHEEEVMALPLTGIEAILSTDELQISSEDDVYDLVVKWARTHYPVLEERREILCSRLARCIRFPYMTYWKLQKVLRTPDDFDHDLVSKLVLDALFFKAKALHWQRILIADALASANRRFIGRAYKLRPIKILEFELPWPQCLVYFDLKREDCANLYPFGRVDTQEFLLGGQGCQLSAQCYMDQQSSFHCAFGLFLRMQEIGSAIFTVDYEFASRSKPTEKFVSKCKGNYTFTRGEPVGYRNFFAIPWTSFIAEDSLYFINGVLHLKAEFTIRH